ncbi:NeuB family protein [bacterium]|jgi:N,N'-diacetyllegionaminate synthase|nr:NeuB family protein [bacterium]
MTNTLFEKLKPENGYVIGEIACGHEGNIDKLEKIIDCIHSGGAQIVKFQIFIPEERATKNHPEWKIFNDLSLTEDEWMRAVKYARKRKLIILADIFGDIGFDIAERIKVDGYKIHSEDLLNSYFIKKVALTEKILLIGVGGAHRSEVYELINYLDKLNLCQQIILMPGVQTFPTSIDAHSIDEVSDLWEKYHRYGGIKVGFADHISGDLPEALTVPLMAFANGACLVEKHITVNRSDKWEDYQSALGKEDFGDFIEQVRKLCPLLSPVGKYNDAETKYRKMFKKSPTVSRDYEANLSILPSDIQYLKHENNKIPLSALQIANKVLREKVVAKEYLCLNKFKNCVGGIIVARCGSSRLPNKAILKIQGRETIALLIERIKRCKNLDKVILATSTDSSDDVLEKIAKREGVLIFRGSLNDLSLRFYEAAKHYKLDHIVRITGDDIVRDETIIDLAIKSHLESSCDVTITKNMPYGCASEIFSVSTLETILNTVQEPKNTEYLEYYLENERYFSVNKYKANYDFDQSIRLTLDYKEDFDFFVSVFDDLYSKNHKFELKDVLNLLKKKPSMISINKNKTLKYKKEELNLKLNI